MRFPATILAQDIQTRKGTKARTRIRMVAGQVPKTIRQVEDLIQRAAERDSRQGNGVGGEPGGYDDTATDGDWGDRRRKS